MQGLLAAEISRQRHRTSTKWHTCKVATTFLELPNNFLNV